MAEARLQRILANIRRRLLGISFGRGLAWGLVAAVLLLIACAWLDLALDLAPNVRLACVVVAGLLGSGLLAWAIVAAVRQGHGAKLARRLDRVGGTGGQILAGVDLARQYGGAVIAREAPVSAGLARLAVERAVNLANNIRSAAAVPLKPLYWPAASVVAVTVVILILATSAPRLFQTQWLRFTDPYGDHPPYTTIQFDVSPGDTHVLYGSSLDVRVTPSGGVVEQIDLVLLPADGSIAGQQVLPMFPEPGGAWRATIAEVTAPGKYFVRSRGARSRQFSYDVITVPEIREVRFRITPPAYTKKPPYEGPMPRGGVAGLPGTKLEMWIKSNRPLSGGPVVFTESGGSFDVTPGDGRLPPPLAMSPVASNAPEATLDFSISRPGKLEVRVTDVAGQTSRESVVVPIQLLHDDRPFVRIMQPVAQSYATPDAALPVQIQAEDDYGISRVQLFRSLNDSRPRPVDIPVPPNQPRRLTGNMPLKLSEYGLKPGDSIRLFARVEDTDPAGAKGSESSIIAVQIISQEELMRMTMAKQGLETLQSKYEQARRRLEALDNKIRKKQEELSKTPQDSELSKQKQKELDDLAEEVEKTADDISSIAGDDLPLDIDRKLRKGLYDLSVNVRQAGKRFFHKSGQLGLTSGEAKTATDELRKDLGLEQEKFQKEANEPLDFLAKVFPLKEDEARFTDLAQRQRDLSDRMQSLKGAAGDDPKLKSRLRDLEEEQKQLREELRDLLQDIENHVAGLPEDPKLDALRKQAAEFATDVRSSDATQEMNSSETNLSEFKGGDAAQHAKNAADTLEKFIGRCKGGMGEEAGQCLKFHPSLSECLGDTVQQLLEMEGLGSKPGMGMGNGGGYSARRNTLRNVGIYGTLPLTSKDSRQAGGRDDKAFSPSSSGKTPDDGDPANSDGNSRIQAGGASDTNVPLRYRRKVGEYFQRVADELGE